MWPVHLQIAYQGLALRAASERHPLNDHPKLELVNNWYLNMSNVEQRPYVPAKQLDTEYPVRHVPIGMELGKLTTICSSSIATRTYLEHLDLYFN